MRTISITDVDDLPRFFEGKGFENSRVVDREHEAVGTDAKTQCNHRDERESGTLGEHSQTELDVMEHGYLGSVEFYTPTRYPDSRGRLLFVTQRNHRIDSRGTASGKIAGEQGHANQSKRGQGKR